MSALREELLAKIARLNETQQRRVLEFVRQIETIETPQPERHYTALELMQMPYDERNRILAERVALAADEDFEVFEANSDEDFDDYVDN